MNAFGILGDYLDRQRGSRARFKAAYIRRKMPGEDDGLGHDGKFAADFVLNLEFILNVEKEAHAGFSNHPLGRPQGLISIKVIQKPDAKIAPGCHGQVHCH
jgi:hypothetical protein